MVGELIEALSSPVAKDTERKVILLPSTKSSNVLNIIGIPPMPSQVLTTRSFSYSAVKSSSSYNGMTSLQSEKKSVEH